MPPAAFHDNDASDASDLELMRRIRAGDQTAFAHLVRRHQQALLNFFSRMGAYTDGEDLVQDTFLKLFQYRDRYRPSAKFTTFLYTLARHAWYDRLRKGRRRERLAGDCACHSAVMDEEGQRRACSHLDAQEALRRLPDALRSVVVLHVYQGLSYEEMAATLNIPLGTVKSRMFYALNRLKEDFNREPG